MSENGSETVPRGWVSAELGDLVEVLDRFRVPVNAEERAGRQGKIPYYGATGQVGWIDDFLFDEELVLLGEDGAPFLDPQKPKAYTIRGKSWVNNHAHVLRGCRGVLNGFVMHQLNQVEFRPFVSGTTRLKLPQVPMRSIPLALPPLPEQHRIVAEIEKHFTRLDAAVAALERVRANLKRYRAAVLKAACEGRLVPTEAELARAEGRSYEPADQLLARILKERRARWEADHLAKMQSKGKVPKDETWQDGYAEPARAEEEGLALLPQGWSWATLGQTAEIQGGIQKQPKRAPAKNAYPFLRVANVLRGRLDLSEVHKIELFGDEITKLRLSPGDLLVVEGNGSPSEIGRMAIWSGAISDCVHQNHIIRARLLGDVCSQYAQAYWNSPDGADRVLEVASSTSGLYTLSVSKIGRLPIPLPPLAEQHRIVAEVERRLSVIDELDAVVDTNLKRAERLRQAILKRAFEGKLVPQDPNDEPASVLLERIRAERALAKPTTSPPSGKRAVRGRRTQRTSQPVSSVS